MIMSAAFFSAFAVFALSGWIALIVEKSDPEILTGSYFDKMGRRYFVRSVDVIHDIVTYDIEFKTDIKLSASGTSATLQHESVTCSRKCFVKLGLRKTINAAN